MGRPQLTLLGALLAAPLLGLAVLLASPSADVHWQHQPSHFWLVLVTAGLNAVLAYATGVAARRRRDRRVHLVSLAFLAAAGFLALHALATPGVLLDRPNLGFVLATPIGLVLAGALAAESAAETDRIRPALLERALLALLAAWAVASLTLLPEVDDTVVPERLSAPLVVLSAVGVALYGFAVVRYLRLWRVRHSALVLGFALAFVLLAEAMVAVAVGRNWHASWWEWHVLMLVAFALIAAMAHREGTEVKTGEASVGVLGTGTGRTVSAIGDTVNLGSRIEALAPPGSVAISRRTADGLWGATTTPLGEVRVKGRDEPVEVLLLRSLPPG